MATLTLLRRRHELAAAAKQRELLEQRTAGPTFDDVLTGHDLPLLTTSRVETLQVNVGKMCNQTCTHCHVDAGPDRREIMERPTMEACLDAVRKLGITTVDITGGAPEMNPDFRWFVGQLRELGCHVIDRCNLTILVANGYRDVPQFLADHRVEIVASLPCYLQENVDKQRGNGVFERSLEALRTLNELGYGHPNSGLPLHLVYNPVGTSLPPDQQQLEHDYHRELKARYGVVFNQLFAITNMPISRYLDDLLQQGRYEAYMERLVAAFNRQVVGNVMCMSTLSVDWKGKLYDCDFNQMLDLPVAGGFPPTIHALAASGAAALRTIQTGRHCFGCTAGAGSSCQGTLT